jgi:hypothetical protein
VIRPNRYTRECLLEMYVTQVMTIQEMAEAYGVSYRAIWQALVRFEIPRRSKAARDQRGPKNPAWKPKTKNYFTWHKRLRAARGTPKHCSKCGTTDPAKHYDWANLTGKFDDPEDYIRVCKSCHAKLDNWGDNLRSKSA